MYSQNKSSVDKTVSGIPGALQSDEKETEKYPEAGENVDVACELDDT